MRIPQVVQTLLVLASGLWGAQVSEPSPQCGQFTAVRTQIVIRVFDGDQVFLPGRRVFFSSERGTEVLLGPVHSSGDVGGGRASSLPVGDWFFWVEDEQHFLIEAGFSSVNAKLSSIDLRLPEPGDVPIRVVNSKGKPLRCVVGAENSAGVVLADWKASSIEDGHVFLPRVPAGLRRFRISVPGIIGSFAFDLEVASGIEEVVLKIPTGVLRVDLPCENRSFTVQLVESDRLGGRPLRPVPLDEIQEVFEFLEMYGGIRSATVQCERGTPGILIPVIAGEYWVRAVSNTRPFLSSFPELMTIREAQENRFKLELRPEMALNISWSGTPGEDKPRFPYYSLAFYDGQDSLIYAFTDFDRLLFESEVSLRVPISAERTRVLGRTNSRVEILHDSPLPDRKRWRASWTFDNGLSFID